jgi:hypothetical protein
MAKELCKLKKHLRRDFEEIAALVDRPRFLCVECGRAANEKRRLCKPKKMPASRARGRLVVFTGGPTA